MLGISETDQEKLLDELTVRGLPDDMHEWVRTYVMDGVPSDDFVTALFANDLAGCFETGDDNNLRRLGAWVQFLCNVCPLACWGSHEKVDLWCERGGLIGRCRDESC